MFNNAMDWFTHLNDPRTMVFIGILTILFHTAFRPNMKQRVECLDDNHGKDGKPQRTRPNHAAFIFEVFACAMIVWYQGSNVFTMLICFWSFVTWVPSYIYRFRYMMKKRKFNRPTREGA